MSAASNQKHRRGFTLIELLFVIAIMGILMSLTIAVMNGVQEQAERTATKVTIRKVNGLLQQRLESFDRAFRRSLKDRLIRDTITLLRANVGDNFVVPLQQLDQAPPWLVVLAKKAGVRFEFPQRFVDRTGSGELDAAGIADGMPLSVYNKIALPIARTQLVQEGKPNLEDDVKARVTSNWAKHTSATESAELLYFFLISSGNFGGATLDADQFTDREIADTDGDGLPEFIDAWGHPLRFYRWPTRLIDPDAPDPFVPDITTIDPTDQRIISAEERFVAGLLIRGLPAAPIPLGAGGQRDTMFVDPDDPVGLLYTLIEDPNFLNMGIELRNAINESGYHTLDTWHTPLIVSAGPDGVLGLREPSEWNASSGIYGNLAQLAGTTTEAGNLGPIPSSSVIDDLTDNVANRNTRAGGRR